MSDQEPTKLSGSGVISSATAKMIAEAKLRKMLVEDEDRLSFQDDDLGGRLPRWSPPASFSQGEASPDPSSEEWGVAVETGGPLSWKGGESRELKGLRAVEEAMDWHFLMSMGAMGVSAIMGLINLILLIIIIIIK